LNGSKSLKDNKISDQMMMSTETVFEQTYKNYLKKIQKVPFEPAAQKLGVIFEENILKIQLFRKEYRVSAEGIIDSAGKRPTYDICVILSKYILLCPDTQPENKDWVTFKDFKDSRPLINYFTHDVEQAISSHFSGKIRDLKKAGNILGGYPPALDVQYDVALQFDALPLIPVVILFNDMDEEFSATCSVLFERRAEKYLDAECLAMLGWHMFSCLKTAQ